MRSRIVPYSSRNKTLRQGEGAKASLTHKRNFQRLPHQPQAAIGCESGSRRVNPLAQQAWQLGDVAGDAELLSWLLATPAGATLYGLSRGHEAMVQPWDLDFPVTTDMSEVCDFLAASGDGARIIFSTYQSARVVGEATRQAGAFDLAIFDEAHKTAGRKGVNFGFALEDGNLPIGKRVFLTATPRHYDLRKKNEEGDKALVYSMDQPATYGPLVHTLSFAEAAERGIICNYSVIISIVTSDMINADLLSRGEVIVEGDVIRTRTVANQMAIQKACEEHDLRRSSLFTAAWHRPKTSPVTRRVPYGSICLTMRPATSMERCRPLAGKTKPGTHRRRACKVARWGPRQLTLATRNCRCHKKTSSRTASSRGR